MKVDIGIPGYGLQEPAWWVSYGNNVASLVSEGMFGKTYVHSTMTADHARNSICADFLKGDAEWLFWIDADTTVPTGAIHRLLSTGRTLVSGLYYGRNGEHPPIAYVKYNKAYRPISKQGNWERGELIEVDTAGMGCCLMHRSVLTDILDKYTVMQSEGGSLHVIKKSDIVGDIKNNDTHPHDGKVYRGQLRTRLFEPQMGDLNFPFFQIEYSRTEDMVFFEIARNAGHKLVLDTSVECGHLRSTPFTGADYRELYGS